MLGQESIQGSGRQPLRLPGAVQVQKVVGGPGLEPGASRSRTVLAACPRASSGVRDRPPELKSRRLGVLRWPDRTASFRECVTRRCTRKRWLEAHPKCWYLTISERGHASDQLRHHFGLSGLCPRLSRSGPLGADVA